MPLLVILDIRVVWRKLVGLKQKVKLVSTGLEFASLFASCWLVWEFSKWETKVKELIQEQLEIFVF